MLGDDTKSTSTGNLIPPGSLFKGNLSGLISKKDGAYSFNWRTESGEIQGEKVFEDTDLDLEVWITESDTLLPAFSFKAEVVKIHAKTANN